MNKLTFLILILFFVTPNYALCQKPIIAEDKVDDMTGKIIRRTDWLTFRAEATRTYYTRLCQVDSTIFFDLKILIGTYVSVDENADFIIKFSDNSTLTLKNYKYIVASNGQGAIGYIGSKALGINPKFIIFKNELETLAKKDIVKVRLYLNDGYIETEINPKKAQLFKKHCVELYIRIFPS